MSLNLGILLALACAVATQLAFLYKHRGVGAAMLVEERHLRGDSAREGEQDAQVH